MLHILVTAQLFALHLLTIYQLTDVPIKATFKAVYSSSTGIESVIIIIIHIEILSFRIQYNGCRQFVINDMKIIY